MPEVLLPLSCRRHYPLYTNTYTGCSYIHKNIVSSPLYFPLESSFTRFPAYSATLAVGFTVSHSLQESPGASTRRALTHDNLQSIHSSGSYKVSRHPVVHKAPRFGPRQPSKLAVQHTVSSTHHPECETTLLSCVTIELPICHPNVLLYEIFHTSRLRSTHRSSIIEEQRYY